MQAVWTDCLPPSAHHAIDSTASTTNTTAADASSLRTRHWVESLPMAGQLSDIRLAQACDVIDAFLEFDDNGTVGLSFSEFTQALASLGLKTPNELGEL